jgi:hypothetical protein
MMGRSDSLTRNHALDIIISGPDAKLVAFSKLRYSFKVTVSAFIVSGRSEGHETRDV